MQDTQVETVEAGETALSLENPDNQVFQEGQDELEAVENSEELGAESAEEEQKDGSKKMEILVSPPLKIRDFEDVKRAVEDHAAWIESVVNPRKDIRGGRANFKGSDLSGYNLAGVDLRGATFTNCICRGTIFSGANLSGATFNRADLSGADFRGAKLKRAQFEHAVLIGVDWDDANTESANFRYAKRDDKDESPAQIAEDLRVVGVEDTDLAADGEQSIVAEPVAAETAQDASTERSFESSEENAADGDNIVREGASAATGDDASLDLADSLLDDTSDVELTQEG